MMHPAAPALLRYAQSGCPVDCSRNWTKDEIIAALEKGARKSALEPAVAAACCKEALERVESKYCRVIKWNDIKDNPPTA